MRRATLFCLMAVLLGCASAKPRNLDRAAADAIAAARRELQNAATAHKVSVQMDRMSYASDPTTTIVHAPLTGIERYRDADFAAGAPIQMLIVRSNQGTSLPNGSYVVKAQHQPGARSGIALFTDRSGAVVARRQLSVYTREQAAVLFEDVYTDEGGPQAIPNITSTHSFYSLKSGQVVYGVDCAGWQPYRVLVYYTVGVGEA